jgi:hypothetical protein
MKQEPSAFERARARGSASLPTAGLCLGAALLIPGAARGAVLYPLPAPAFRPESGITMTLATPWQKPPVSGWATVRVAVHNGSGRAGRWSLRFVSQAYRGKAHQTEARKVLSLGAGEAREFEVCFPIANLTDSNYPVSTVTVDVSGPGLASRRTQLWHDYTPLKEPARSLTGFSALSESLATRYLEELTRELRSRQQRELHATRFSPAGLPLDVRAYSGLASLWLSEEEYHDLPGAVRRTLSEWLAQGGQLLLVRSAPDGASASVATEERPGFGSLTRLAPLSEPATFTAALDVLARARPMAAFVDEYKTWPLLQDLPTPSIPATFLLLFVLGYSVLVGPVNLFFCHRLKRNRALALYWTVPALALVASGLLALLIVLKDGIGGTGRRWTATLLLPRAALAVTLQEQASRTGLLPRQSFDVREPFVMESVPIGDTGQRLGMEENRYSGDWFRSRRLQGQLLVATRPSRARLTVVGEEHGAPIVLSSINGTISELFVVDAQGSCFKARGVVTGRRTAMQPAASRELRLFWTRRTAAAGPYSAALVRGLPGRAGFFFASLEGSENAMATNPLIRWREVEQLVLGPISES